MNKIFFIQKSYLHFRDDLFFLAYLFLFFNVMLSTYINFGDSVGIGISYSARIFYILFLGICVVMLVSRETYSVKEILSIGGLLILGVISYYFAGWHYFFDFTLIIAISKGIDFEKFIRRAIVLFALFLFVIICLAGLEIISSVVKERSDNTQMRNSLGFSHPNNLGLLIFQLIAAVIALERKHLKTIHLWLLLALGVIFYWITKSQSCLVGVCLLVFTVLLYKILARRVLTSEQMKKVFMVILILLAVGVVFAIQYFWVNPDMLSFQTLSGRIEMAQKYLDAYGVNLFGQDILSGAKVALPGYSEGYSYLDNGEVWYLIRFGVVGCSIFFYTYIRMIIKTINKKEFVLCLIAVIYLIYSLTESSALRVPLNFMLIYAGIMLYSGNLLKREKWERRSYILMDHASMNK